MGAAHNIRKLNGCVIDCPHSAANLVIDCFFNHNLLAFFLDIIAPVWVTFYHEPVLTASGNKIQPVISSSGDPGYFVSVDSVKKYNAPFKIDSICVMCRLFHSSVVTVISHWSVSFQFLVSSFLRFTTRILYRVYSIKDIKSIAVFKNFQDFSGGSYGKIKKEAKI